jgi:hypothetical protein
MKNAAFWDIRTQFVPHRKHVTSPLQSPAGECYVRVEVFTTVTMKNAVFWDVTPCGCSKNRRFGGMSVLKRATRRNILEDGILHDSKRSEHVMELL